MLYRVLTPKQEKKQHDKTTSKFKHSQLHKPHRNPPLQFLPSSVPIHASSNTPPQPHTSFQSRHFASPPPSHFNPHKTTPFTPTPHHTPTGSPRIAARAGDSTPSQASLNVSGVELYVMQLTKGRRLMAWVCMPGCRVGGMMEGSVGDWVGGKVWRWMYLKK